MGNNVEVNIREIGREDGSGPPSGKVTVSGWVDLPVDEMPRPPWPCKYLVLRVVSGL